MSSADRIHQAAQAMSVVDSKEEKQIPAQANWIFSLQLPFNDSKPSSQHFDVRNTFTVTLIMLIPGQVSSSLGHDETSFKAC